jgi:aminopeptidase N
MTPQPDARSSPGLPHGEPRPGVSHELAEWRSERYRDLRYELEFELAAGLERFRGRLTVRFGFAGESADLVLDWRPPNVAGLPAAHVWDTTVNGRRVAARECEEHLMFDASELAPADNVVALAFDGPIATAGTAITRYTDRKDGTHYAYTLLVPSDASTVFPCVDQPDVKARFTLAVTAPAGCLVVANAPLARAEPFGAGERFAFEDTEPISTYLFAFAVGPFGELRDAAGQGSLFVRRSRLEDARREAREVLRLNGAAVRFFETYFAHPFPFAKYDLVLLPEFAYGGMEHAGATFLREDSVLFPFEPGAIDLLRRAQLIFHEASHQWFGDLVTMHWFDDLWLKEGFANLMAMEALDALLPQFDARNWFRALKTAAYHTDVTAGTTAIRQALPNLSAAKSAYGSIVYSKAPAVLRQAQFYLGEDAFRAAVRDFLQRHAYAAASWADLVAAFERACGRPLERWADAWVRRAGVPRVQADWREDSAGRIEVFRLVQTNARSAQEIWPMRVKLLAAFADGAEEVFEVALEEAITEVAALRGKPAPHYVFANYEDWAYGLFALDARSRDALVQGLALVQDGFLRALLWDALWESVRDAELAPAQWLELALRELPAETDEMTVSGLLGYVQTALRWYVSDAQRALLRPHVEALLRAGMLQGRTPGLRSAYLRAFIAVASTSAARDELKRLLAGELSLAAIPLASVDRFRIVQTLLATGDPQADALLASQAAADGSDEGRRYAFAAAAARPDAQSKQRYLDAFLTDAALPERWIEDALGPLNPPEQETLTLASLRRALDALPALKRTRRIFFVNQWLAAFIGGQRSAQAQAIVEDFLAGGTLDADLRRKVLEALDGLARTVRIRSAE